MISCDLSKIKKLNEEGLDIWEIKSMISEGEFGDTNLLKQALAIVDNLLVSDTSKNNKFTFCPERIRILNALDRKEDALEAEEDLMLLLPETNNDRLLFMVKKSIREAEKNTTNFYMNRSLSVCDQILNNGYNDGYAAAKAAIIFIRDGKEAALKYISETPHDIFLTGT